MRLDFFNEIPFATSAHIAFYCQGVHKFRQKIRIAISLALVKSTNEIECILCACVIWPTHGDVTLKLKW